MGNKTSTWHCKRGCTSETPTNLQESAAGVPLALHHADFAAVTKQRHARKLGAPPGGLRRGRRGHRGPSCPPRPAAAARPVRLRASPPAQLTTPTGQAPQPQPARHKQVLAAPCLAPWKSTPRAHSLCSLIVPSKVLPQSDHGSCSAPGPRGRAWRRCRCGGGHAADARIARAHMHTQLKVQVKNFT